MKLTTILFLSTLIVLSTPSVFARENSPKEDHLPSQQRMVRLEATKAPRPETKAENEVENENKIESPKPSSFELKNLLERAKSIIRSDRKEATDSAKQTDRAQNKLKEKVIKSQQRACGLNIAAYQKSRQTERKQVLADCRKNNPEISACKPLLKQFELDTKTKIESMNTECKALRDKVLGVTTDVSLR